jgi:transcriptional regulator with XRE-family HTH domain
MINGTAVEHENDQERAKALKFSGWLRDEMAQRGLNQAELARRVGVSKAAVNKWVKGPDEKDWRQPDITSLFAIARALQLSKDTVLAAAGKDDRIDFSHTAAQKDAIGVIEQLSDASLELVYPQLIGLLAHEQNKAAERRRKKQN